MINNETAKSTYIVSDISTPYPIGFAYQYNPDGTPQIKVYKNKLSDTPLVYNTNYKISNDGLSIVLLSDIEVGDRLDIIRDIPLVQLSDYVIGRIDPEQIEQDMDLAVERDQQIQANIDFVAEVPEDHEQRIQQNTRDIATINSLIPTQTTTENQLTDRDFVNSSIATSTATFRGTYSSLAELEAVTADANDYGFVESTDAVGNTLYSRYKYNGTAWTFEYNLNNSSFTAAQWAAINSGITAELVAAYHNTTGRNVGDVFFTMRTDSGLNGAVMCDGTQYNTTDFTGAQSIGALLQAGKVPYVSLAQYASLLSTNGSVGVFGWDGVGTTAFRVPSLNDIFIEIGTAAQIGDYIKPGIPNIQGVIKTSGTNQSGSGAITYTRESTGAPGWDGYGAANGKWELDASSASSVYGASNTVQPKAVRYRAMVQLAIAATDEALETCTSVLADVAANTAAIAGADYVVESQIPTAQNNYTWYRKYKSGWVEQGGTTNNISVAANTGTNVDITLPVIMADTNYNIMTTRKDGGSGFAQTEANTNATSTSVIRITLWNNVSTAASGGKFCWQVSGVAA